MTAFDFRCSMVSAAHITQTNDVSFRTITDGIRSGRWAEPVKVVRAAFASGGKDAASGPKRQLPAIMFSGIFSERNAAGLKSHSGAICVDLDGLDERTGQLKEQIASDPHALAVFVSPSGNGLKVIFRCDPAKAHAESFHAAESFVAENFGLKIDQACKDVSRLCFISDDPEAFVADDSIPIPYPAPKPVDFRAPVLGLDVRPGDDYDSRHNLPDLLIKHGWSKCTGGFTRPGKESGLSATFDKVPGQLHVFSSEAAPFLPNHNYKPWHAYAFLEHGGDFSAAARALVQQGYGTPPKSRQQQNLERVAGPAVEQPAPTSLRSIFDFPVVPDGDGSILLGERYLNRGDGMVIVSTSGMGKSAMCVQGATELALNRGPFGIQGNGSLKSLIVQSEDSDGDIGEVAHSIKTVLNLTPDQIADVNSKVKVVCDRINRGHRFIAALKLLIAEFKPDLVWINPLQAFIDGDVTDSKDLGAFLREGLNSLNNPPSFGYVIIHHTTKPATGKEKAERQWHEVMYDMAGGAEIINWARAILSLRATPTEGEFNLVLAKRGRRAGVTKKVPHGVGFILEPVTTIPLKHAKGHIDVPGHKRGIPKIYWESREEDAAPAKFEKSIQGGRPEKHAFENYTTVFPQKSGPGLPYNQIAQILMSNGPLKPGSIQSVLRRWIDQGHVEEIRETGKQLRWRSAL